MVESVDSLIERRKRIFAKEKNTTIDNIYVIPKRELVVGQEYEGVCRNSGKATWFGTKFGYDRYKFGAWFKDTINHFEDDNGYDLFIPMKVINNEQKEET